MISVAEKPYVAEEFSDETCPYCLDHHSLTSDGPYPVAHCPIDA